MEISLHGKMWVFLDLRCRFEDVLVFGGNSRSVSIVHGGFTKMGINVTNAPKSILYEGGCNFNLVNDVKFSNDLAKAAEGPTLVTNASKALDIASRAFFARKLLIWYHFGFAHAFSLAEQRAFA